MNPNIDELGRSHRRHSYSDDKQENRPLLAIFGLIATLADIDGWDKSYPIEKMFKLVSDEPNLRQLLGEDILSLKANLVSQASSGCYHLINDNDVALVAIEPNRERFNQAVVGYRHEVYLVGPDSADKS